MKRTELFPLKERKRLEEFILSKRTPKGTKLAIKLTILKYISRRLKPDDFDHMYMDCPLCQVYLNNDRNEGCKKCPWNTIERAGKERRNYYCENWNTKQGTERAICILAGTKGRQRNRRIAMLYRWLEKLTCSSY